jgi:hypothetical protein
LKQKCLKPGFPGFFHRQFALGGTIISRVESQPDRGPFSSAADGNPLRSDGRPAAGTSLFPIKRKKISTPGPGIL